jgi:5'-nucleotidase
MEHGLASQNVAIRAIRHTSLAAIAALVLAACAGQPRTPQDEITISIFGTNDVHGQLLPAGERGGLVAISAYVDALRAARTQDNGAVLVIDAGDMWQGTLESNLVEGTAVVDAYNAIGFDAAAIGNHEFDFGPVGKKQIPENSDDDPRGALKQRASEANFPVLAANVIDDSTGRPVEWDNVRPSTIIDVQGIKVGVIGVVTEHALQTTILANTPGLRIAPLADTIVKEATVLRERGSSIVIVTAHAGSSCSQFDDPLSLSSCDMAGEIMQVAEALPTGLVDHIIGGHVHAGIAHIVNGISITSSFSNTRAFSRVDLTVDRERGSVVSRIVYPPHQACLLTVKSSGACASPDDEKSDVQTAVYEGHEIAPNAQVVKIAERAAAFAAAIKDEKLGVYLESAFEQPPATESALANLMTDALLESIGADIAIHNVMGGIRNGLPQGALTFGAVYEMFPFDNRVVELELTGRQLREVLATQVHRMGRRAGFSGMRVFVNCADDRMDVVIYLSNGETVLDDDRVTVIVNDFLAFGGDGILTPVLPIGGFDIDNSRPLTRDVLIEWFRRKKGSLSPDDFSTAENPKWNVPDPLPSTCSL